MIIMGGSRTRGRFLMSDELDLTNKRNLSIDYLNVVFSGYSDGLYDAPGESVGAFKFCSRYRDGRFRRW